MLLHFLNCTFVTFSESRPKNKFGFILVSARLAFTRYRHDDRDQKLYSATPNYTLHYVSVCPGNMMDRLSAGTRFRYCIN
jgi:hypothetical protein